MKTLYEQNIVANRNAEEHVWYSVQINGATAKEPMQYVADGKYFISNAGKIVDGHKVTITSILD